MKKTVSICLCALFALLCACGQGGAQPISSGADGTAHVEETRNREAFESTELQFLPESETQVVAVFETSRGQVRCVLYPEEAPLAVENFCALAEEGYYNGVAFSRVLRDFVIQSGPGAGGDKSIWGHPFHSEYSDKLRHYAGALCMVAADGGGHMSRFYIVASPQGSVDETMQAALQAAGTREGVVATYLAAGGAPYLDFTDTVFGQVVTGMDVVDEVSRVPADEAGTPKSPVTVDSVTIHGYTP